MRELDRVLGSVEAERLAPPPTMEQLLGRVNRRRTRRRARVASIAVVAVVAVVATVGSAIALWPEDSSPQVEVGAGPRSTTTSPEPGTAVPPGSTLPTLGPGIPDPVAPTGQTQVPMERSAAPLAVGQGAVWVGTATGIAAIDPVSLETLGDVAIELPVVAVATGADGIWILSGSQQASYGGASDNQLPPYHLTRIDPATRRVEYETELPFRSSERGNQSVRLSASPDGAWVGFREQVVHVDAASGALVPVDLGGYLAGNIAADTTGLWIATAGGMNDGTADARVLRVDGATNAVRVVPGIANGFMWSIAATDDAAWLVEVFAAAGEPEATTHLVRIDASTMETTARRVPGIAVVVGDDQVWVQVYDRYQGPAELRGLVGQVDTDTGEIVRTVDIEIGGIPGSSGNGYNNPPFAVADRQIWSAYDGLERTTL